MNAPPPIEPSEQDPLLKKVRLHGERRRRFDAEGGPTVLRRLAQVGVLGWMIVTPALGGLFLGRWFDRLAGSGLFWTAPLLMV
ncbi:AtpZ/AtpI family protein, partial [Zavarzinia sp.]|uniref:AtpZ/AtpI family protein n=1 Tax=Zavarzinia sp. TaxID=2027920 RepID=UPI00356A84CD